MFTLALRVGFLQHTNATRPFFQVLMLEFLDKGRAWVQCLDLVVEHFMVLGYLEQCLNTAIVSEPSHQCSGTKCDHNLRYVPTTAILRDIKRFHSHGKQPYTFKLEQKQTVYMRKESNSLTKIMISLVHQHGCHCIVLLL